MGQSRQYKCRLCGGPKKDHVCPMLVAVDLQEKNTQLRSFYHPMENLPKKTPQKDVNGKDLPSVEEALTSHWIQDESQSNLMWPIFIETELMNGARFLTISSKKNK